MAQPQSQPEKLPEPDPEMEKRTQSRPGVIRIIISNVLRLTLWYSILTAIFRCPGSLDEISPDSHLVCKPYLITRTQVEPYLRPYYDEYLSSHVEKARPHVVHFNDVVVAPAVAVSTAKYDAYAAPVLARAVSIASSEWNRVGQPKLDVVTTKVESEYQQHLAPHVTYTREFMAPYLVMAEVYAKWTWSNGVVPTYHFLVPYARIGGAHTSRFITTTVIPYAKRGYFVSVEFVERTILPRLRALYAEHVEPQLVRIQDHIVQSKEAKGGVSKTVAEVASAVSAAALSSKWPTSQAVSVTPSPGPLSTPLASSVPSATVSPPSSSVSPEQPTSPRPVRNEAGSNTVSQDDLRKKLGEDLENWQDKFNHAITTGADDLGSKVGAILTRQVEKRVDGDGASHLSLLSVARDRSCDSIRSSINDVVRSLPKEPSRAEMEEAYRQVDETISTSQNRFKVKVLDLRTWKADVIDETNSMVESALAATLEVIDSIRDLGLQDIGMRWTYMDGVSFDDWTRYHEMKIATSKWRRRVAAAAVEHEGWDDLAGRAGEIEVKLLDLLDGFLDEMDRLKGVSRWKLHQADTSADFSDRPVPEFVSREDRAEAARVKEAELAAELRDRHAESGSEPGESAGVPSSTDSD